LKTIVICSYREWSENISDYLLSEFDKLAKFIKIKNKDEFNQLIKDETKVDLFLFIGWSEIISKNIVDKNMCFCLHPSLLPKYRGGSPIQHQMINLEKQSGVTIFKMNEGIDTGPVYFQESFNLENLDLKDVFQNIIKIGTKGFKLLIKDVLNDKNLKLKEQKQDEATTFKRRIPEQSEITIEDFQSLSANELSNKINSLQDPYPNAFIKCKDGSILFLTSSKYKSNSD
tara:strand:- start:7361 stop:8047 length:687 start_codon:yes stop_codon:yes gene_type:complete